MTNRPKIPAEVEREILLECGHRCAICGTPFPLERAHIIPWHKSKEHKSEDLICLCANCHELADRGKLGERTLREYKRKPWVIRQYKTENHVPGPTTKVELTIDMELEHFDEAYQRLLRYALAAFLGVSEHVISIKSIRRGSVKVIIELPIQSAEKLLSAYKRNDSELVRYCAPFTLLHVHGKGFVDDKKLEELITKYYGAISAFVRRKIARREDVEDIVQETFAKTYSQKIKTAPYAYLKQVALSLISAYYKKPSLDLERLIGKPIDPKKQSKLQDLKAHLRELVQTLPAKEMTIIKLRYLTDQPLKYKEIQEILGITPPTCKKWHDRAISKLRKEIERYLD